MHRAKATGRERRAVIWDGQQAGTIRKHWFKEVRRGRRWLVFHCGGSKGRSIAEGSPCIRRHAHSFHIAPS